MTHAILYSSKPVALNKKLNDFSINNIILKLTIQQFHKITIGFRQQDISSVFSLIPVIIVILLESSIIVSLKAQTGLCHHLICLTVLLPYCLINNEKESNMMKSNLHSHSRYDDGSEELESYIKSCN